MLVTQGLDDCEVIVINDGSTDNTEEICRLFSTRHHHIRIISLEKNSGVSVARNTGLAEAKGKYICFFDSDDTFMPNTLSYFKGTVKKQNGVDIFCFGSETQINGKIVTRHIYQKYSGMVFESTSEFLKLVLEKRIHCSMDSTLISRELLLSNKILFRQTVSIGEDVEFMLRIFSCSKSIRYDSRICYVYYIRSDSVMRGYKSYSISQFNVYIIIEKYLQELIAENRGLSRSAYFFLANLYVANLYFYLNSNIRDNNINKLFLENKKILYKNYSGQKPKLLLFYALRFMPIKLLFCIFHKNYVQKVL